MVISLYAKAMSTGDIQSRLAEIYDTSISREPISKITGAASGSAPMLLVPRWVGWVRHRGGRFERRSVSSTRGDFDNDCPGQSRSERARLRIDSTETGWLAFGQRRRR